MALRLAAVFSGTAAILFMGGCGGGAENQPPLERGNVSMVEATDLVSERYPLREGMWEVVGGISDLEIPDLPADTPQTRDLLQMIRMRVGQQGRMSGNVCLRQQDARTALSSVPGLDPQRCRAQRVHAEGNSASIVLVCTGQADGNGRSRMEINSTFAENVRTIETRGTITLAPGPGAAQREARLTSSVRMRRIGDCPGQVNSKAGQGQGAPVGVGHAPEAQPNQQP